MDKFGTLYMVGTPIGNLGDITLRAVEILKTVPVVACEDTRVTKNLLNHLGSNASLISFHSHSDNTQKFNILRLLTGGQNIAYVTDAGTPGISDPGNELVSFIREANAKIPILPIPGVSALSSIVSVSGMDLREFVFVGFAPKKKTQTFFRNLIEQHKAFIYYDSPHRVIKNLDTISTLGGEVRNCVVGRELTKIHETLYTGTVEDVLLSLRSLPMIKGELVVLIGKASKKSSS